MNPFDELPNAKQSWAYANLVGQDKDAAPRRKPRAITASTNVNPIDREHDVDCTAGAVTLTLEDAAGTDGRWHFFTKTDASANAMTIDGFGAQTISGAATVSTDVQFLTIAVRSNGTGWIGLKLASAAAAGAVTSVGLTMPTAVFDVAGSPITGAGTLAVTFDTQAANIVFAGPGSGAAAVPTFRALVTADLANDLVTYAKIQNVSATDKLLGRSTAGAGDVEEIALTAAGRALIDDADAAAQQRTLGIFDQLCFAIGDETTAITTGTAKLTFHLPRTFVPTVIFGGLSTASTSGEVIVDINEAGTSVMTTNKLKWDANEKTTDTYSGTAATLTDTSWARYAEMTIDIDSAGTGAKGLKVYIEGYWTY